MKRIVVTGSSGFVASALRKIGSLKNALWLSRSSCGDDRCKSVPDYKPASMSPYLSDCDTLIHLAAKTRERRKTALYEANVRLTVELAKTLFDKNPGARFIFLSSDMAGFATSPYGISKAEAERNLEALGKDIVCLRSSMIACGPAPGPKCPLYSMKKAASKKLVLLPGGGQFPIAPLWIKDMALVLEALADRQGRAEDNGIWSMTGKSLAFRKMVENMATIQSNRSVLLPVPLSAIVALGKIVATLNPTTKFPLDFFESRGADAFDVRSDIFSHLVIAKTGTEDIARLV